MGGAVAGVTTVALDPEGGLAVVAADQGEPEVDLRLRAQPGKDSGYLGRPGFFFAAIAS